MVFSTNNVLTTSPLESPVCLLLKFFICILLTKTAFTEVNERWTGNANVQSNATAQVQSKGLLSQENGTLDCAGYT